MEFNRNHYFLLGIVLLLLGIQFRMVEAYTLNEKTSKFLVERVRPMTEGDGGLRPFFASIGPTPRRVLHPPEWLGWALLSIGSVLILHSLAMKKPGG